MTNAHFWKHWKVWFFKIFLKISSRNHWISGQFCIVFLFFILCPFWVHFIYFSFREIVLWRAFAPYLTIVFSLFSSCIHHVVSLDDSDAVLLRLSSEIFLRFSLVKASPAEHRFAIRWWYIVTRIHFCAEFCFFVSISNDK